MRTLEERVAYLEGRVRARAHWRKVRDAIRSLERRIDLRFEAVDRGFDLIDRRFETIDRRFEGVDRRFDGVDRRIASLDEKVSRHFVWLVGLQVTTLAAIVGALLSRP